MNPLTLTLIQSPLFWQDPAQNRAMFTRLFASIQQPTDAILLPETFSTGFSMDTSFAEPMDGETVAWMRSEASRLGVAIAGSLMIRDDGAVWNRFIWMNPDGTCQWYNKRHLFRMADEHQHFAAGSSKTIIEYNGWKLCLLVCYDLRFPVWIRRTAEQDYDALVVVANWPERREFHWRTLLQARAIENQSYVVAVNRCGTDGNDVSYSGYSGLISPKGEWMTELAHDSAVQQVTLHPQELTDWRTSFPAWQDADGFSLRDF